MRVVHINKSDQSGGAAVAASRITAALRGMDVAASLLVGEKRSTHPWVVPAVETGFQRGRLFINFLQEVAAFLPHEKSRSGRFAYSAGRKGLNLASHPLVQQADVIHLHWFNQGYMSLKGLGQLLALGKPVVWTLHDMWSFTGGCHYAGNCAGYRLQCGTCPLIQDPGVDDISARQFKRKQAIYSTGPLALVACSHWLAGVASEAALLQGHAVSSIPNPIETSVFRPLPRDVARERLGMDKERKILLFGAANVADPRKGMALLWHALRHLAAKRGSDGIQLVVFGKAPEGLAKELPFPVKVLNYVSSTETLVDLYNAADVFVLPSLEDNLPNTVMEALACGTPVAAFRIGGVPEMVAHGICGYLASAGDAGGLAEGIDFLLYKSRAETLRLNAREKVVQNFSPRTVAGQYLKLYEHLLQEKTYVQNR